MIHVSRNNSVLHIPSQQVAIMDHLLAGNGSFIRIEKIIEESVNPNELVQIYTRSGTFITYNNNNQTTLASCFSENDHSWMWKHIVKHVPLGSIP